jgi:hypothetical protein
LPCSLQLSQTAIFADCWRYARHCLAVEGLSEAGEQR